MVRAGTSHASVVRLVRKEEALVAAVEDSEVDAAVLVVDSAEVAGAAAEVVAVRIRR